MQDADAVGRIHVDVWRTAYRGIVPDAHLASLSYERRIAQNADWLGRDAVLSFVAEDASGRVIGFANGGALRPTAATDGSYVGELYALYISQQAQRAGVGRALVGAIAGALVARGLPSMLVWVLAANPACAFYERLGGTRVGHKQIEIGGVLLDEVSYGWLDVRELSA